MCLKRIFGMIYSDREFAKLHKLDILLLSSANGQLANKGDVIYM